MSVLAYQIIYRLRQIRGQTKFVLKMIELHIVFQFPADSSYQETNGSVLNAFQIFFFHISSYFICHSNTTWLWIEGKGGHVILEGMEISIWWSLTLAPCISDMQATPVELANKETVVFF